MKKSIMKKLSLDEYKINSATYRGNNILTLDFNQAIPFLDYLTQKDESITFITRKERIICKYIETKNGALYYKIIGLEC